MVKDPSTSLEKLSLEKVFSHKNCMNTIRLSNTRNVKGEKENGNYNSGENADRELFKTR